MQEKMGLNLDKEWLISNTRRIKELEGRILKLENLHTGFPHAPNELEQLKSHKDYPTGDPLDWIWVHGD